MALADFLPRPAATKTTENETGALTVAGQWRIFTAFPNILAIAVMSNAAAWSCRNDAMESVSMT
jgi:hypothetical protein